jgi:hypothetical protein
MKRALNSLLTLYPIPFKAKWGILTFPRDIAGMNRRHLTPFIFHRKISRLYGSLLPVLSCPPHCLVCSWLGEGRIQSLFQRSYLVLFSIVYAALFVATGLCANETVISLKEEASIQSENMSLKDVAELNGPDTSLLKNLAQISLGLSPEFGKVKIMSR